MYIIYVIFKHTYKSVFKFIDLSELQPTIYIHFLQDQAADISNRLLGCGESPLNLYGLPANNYLYEGD